MEAAARTQVSLVACMSPTPAPAAAAHQADPPRMNRQAATRVRKVKHTSITSMT